MGRGFLVSSDPTVSPEEQKARPTGGCGGGAPVHRLTEYWALHGKGTRFTFVQLLLVEPVYYLFLHKCTHEFQSREPGRTEPGGTNQPVRV